MAQRLVLASKARDEDDEPVVTIQEWEDFVKRAREYGLGPRFKIRISEDTNTYLFWVPLPEGIQIANGRRVKIRKKTKKQLEVDQQIAEYKKKVAEGIQTPGHTPAVGAPKRRRRVVRRKK